MELHQLMEGGEVITDTPPVTAAQTNPIDKFRNTFAILHNLGYDELAGIVTSEASWTRFNNNLTTFVLKLDDERLGALYRLVESRQPERLRDAGLTTHQA